MTRRQRVLAAIEHREPDRVPVDLGAMRSTGITAVAYNRLKKHRGWSWGETLVYDVVQQLAQPEQQILDFWDADVVDIGRAFLTEPDDWKDFTLPDGSAARIPASVNFEPFDGGWCYRAPDGTLVGIMPKGVLYMSQACFPMMHWSEPWDVERVPEVMKYVTWAALPTAPYHVPWTEENRLKIRETAKRFYESTDYAVMFAFGGNLLEWGQFLRRIDNFLCDIAERPVEVERLLDKLVVIHLNNLERVLETIGDCADIIQLGDDYGTQCAAQISPRTYRKLFKPRLKAIVDCVKQKSNLKVFLHSCGAVTELLPDIIDAGIEILNPVQTSCPGMEPERLKREFGKDICFWGGGCDTQTILARATPKQVREHVKERMDIFGTGGGFVFAQIHNVMPNVPPQNILAMVEAARDFRR